MTSNEKGTVWYQKYVVRKITENVCVKNDLTVFVATAQETVGIVLRKCSREIP